MKNVRRSVIVAGFMTAASIAGVVAKPTRKPLGGLGFVLKDGVPTEFANWRTLPATGVLVLDPQTEALLDRLYGQRLTRTYANEANYQIMLSMAYGDDQRGGLQAHRPEVCYPAQGFKLVGDVTRGSISTAFGGIDVTRLFAVLGSRSEPVTYWLSVGNQIVNSPIDKRMAEFKAALTGEIPGGLLFRVSSIDPDTGRAFAAHQSFVSQMMAAVPADRRKKLCGLSGQGRA